MKFNQFILAIAWDAAAFPAWIGDSYQHTRDATAKIEYAGQAFLTDPFLASRHFMNGFAGTFNSQARMPPVGLPMSVNKILDGVDAVIVIHTHEDRWGETAACSILKNLPIYAQHHTDAVKIRNQDFTDMRVLNSNAVLNSVTISKTGGVHGTEAIYANPQLAGISDDAMGAVFQSSRHRTAYVMGDIVWTADVNRALNHYKPDYLIMNTGYTLISDISDGIITGTADALRASQIMPKVKIITVHVDAVNHTAVSRTDMRKLVRGQGIESRMNVPEGGEILKLD